MDHWTWINFGFRWFLDPFHYTIVSDSNPTVRVYCWYLDTFTNQLSDLTSQTYFVVNATVTKSLDLQGTKAAGGVEM